MNHYFLVRVIIVFLLSVNNLNVYAQTSNLRFEYLTDEQDVYGNSNYEILQDSRGYIWLSSRDGLIKYDGYTFTRFQYNAFNPNSVSQNIISTIWIDKKDTIWLGTPEGLCKFDPHTEKFTRYASITSKMPDNISAINEDNEGNIWIGNWTGKLWRYNKKKGEFLKADSLLEIQKLPRFTPGFRNYILSLYKDKSGTLWIGDNTALHRLNQVQERPGKDEKISFTHYQYNPSEFINNRVGSIFEDQNGILWFGSAVGLKSFNPKTGEFSGLLRKPGEPRTTQITGAISQIAEDHESNLWIATYGNGLHKLNRERTGFISWFQNENRGFGLKSDDIPATMLDKGGNLFVSTDKGLHKLILNQKAFGLLQDDSTDINSLSDNQVMSLCEDRAGNVWIGTFNGGLNRWDKKSGKVSHYLNVPFKPQSLKSNKVNAILNDSDGNLWICNGNILSRLTNEKGTFEHFISNPAKLSNDDLEGIYSICQDKDGLIWLGTGFGIKSFNPKTHEFRHYYKEEGNPDGISDYDAVSIFADSRGNIWVGTSSVAFNRFNKHTGKFKQYKNNPADSSSISSNIVKCIFEDSKGNLWLGTSGGGLCQYNYNGDNFTTHLEKKDVPWNTVLSIQEDETGNLWLGTDDGLSCYIISEKKIITYDMKDGLQSNFFGGGGYRHLGSSYKGRDGTLYFGGINGLNYFDPSKIQPNNFIPPIVITQFKLFDKLLPGKNEANEIVLNYDENFFSFEFAALNYTNSSKNKYAYQLEGVDNGWVYCGSRRYTSYTNIAPGEYTFKVKGSNNDGIWNEKGISVRIVIRPPWWKTWWAYSFYGLCILAGILFIDRIQRKRVIEKERTQTREKELSQAKEIEKAYHELKTTQAQLIQSEKMASLGELTAGIAHEIQNPLNFVNNFSEVNKELLIEMKDEIDKGNLNEVKAIANDVIDNEEKINQHGQRADAIVKGMLQHSRSSSGVKEPTDINKLADEYLRLAYHGFRAKDKSFNATLKTDFDESIGNISIIRQDIGRVLLNLINNAFYSVAERRKQSGTDYEPAVLVSTKKLKDSVGISVKDNGIGIRQKVVDKIFQPFFTTKPTGQGTGLGLSLSYDIIKAHDGEIRVETKEGEGAKFLITLPKT